MTRTLGLIALAAGISAAVPGISAAAPLAGRPDFFRRGDSNLDGPTGIDDVIQILEYLFRDGPEPPCLEAADGNDDGVIDVADPIGILFHLFAGTGLLPPPGPIACGTDSTPDALGCLSYPCPQGLNQLSDAFDGSTLNRNWSLLRPEVVDIELASGSLILKPNQFALWFNNSRGPFVYKVVTGDFRVSARVRSRRRTDPSQPPSTTIHLGGLMARNPAGNGTTVPEDYLFIVVGQDENDLSVETKTTNNSSSVYQGPPWPSGDAELRVCRLGSEFRLYKRALGEASWTLAESYQRPDLPAALQVGPVTYAASDAPDLRVSFEQVSYEDVTEAADCERD